MAATGSRIPGAQVECPAPMTVIAAEGIQVHGLVDAAAIIRWVTWTYDGNRRLGATDLMKATVIYQMTPNAALTFTVDNLLDMQPGNGHKTWTSDPYDARSGFRPVGRAFFLEVNYRFGGR